MPDKKLTDNEIISTLQKNIRDSERINSSYALLNLNLVKETFDLINRLQAEKQELEIELKAMRGAANSYKAENERLKNAYKQCAWERDNFQADNERLYGILENKGGLILTKTAKAKAYKEFAELIKKDFENPYIQKSGLDFVDFLKGVVDNRLKRTVGEDK